MNDKLHDMKRRFSSCGVNKIEYRAMKPGIWDVEKTAYAWPESDDMIGLCYGDLSIIVTRTEFDELVRSLSQSFITK